MIFSALLLLVGTVSAAVPGAAFSGSPTSGTAPLTVAFADQSNNSPTGWAWFFGDETYGGAWTEQNASSGWPARYEYAGVAMPNGSIVLAGGWNGAASFNDAWVSRDYGTTWTRQIEHAGWSERRGHAMVAIGDTIILMGGSGAGGYLGYLNDTWRSTDGGTTWTEVNSSAGWTARYGHTAVALPDGSIVLMGGRDAGTWRDDVWRSVDGGENWTCVNPSAGWTARLYHTAVAIGDTIILMGGMGDSLATPTYFNDVWRSEDGGATWEEVNASAGWSGRAGHTSVAMPDGSIILMGGSGGSYRNDVWRSVDGGVTWNEVNPGAGWTGRIGHSSVALPDGSVVLMGGRDVGTYKNDVWRLQPAGSIAEDPSHTYTVPGTYTVTLQAYNDDGYSATRRIDYITVSAAPAAPTAAFSGTPTSGAAPLTVHFTDTSTGSPIVWNWSFGDGEWFNTTSAAEKNPTHTYTAAGTYAVSLTATNAEGSDTHSEAGYIEVSAAPVPPEADFSGTPQSGTAPLTVRFTDASTGGPTGWAWFFGDETYGGAWTEQNASSGWTKRYAHSSVALPDGRIVLMGGYDDNLGLSNDTWVSGDNGATWTNRTAEPGADAGWTGRMGQSSVALPDGSIVLMGGGDDDSARNDTWVSEDGGKTWTEVNGSSGWKGRYGHTSVALPDGSIVVMGGIDDDFQPLDDVWRSTDGGATWSEMTPDAGWPARSAHSSVVLPDGSIVVMGGEGVVGTLQNDVWRSTDSGTSWTRQTEHAGWSGRYGHGAVVMPDGSIVVMGGLDDSAAPSIRNDVWRSTDGGVTWNEVNAGAGWSGRLWYTSVAMRDGSIVITGGMDDTSTMLNDAWRLQPAGSTAENPTHTYTAPGTYTVTLQAYNSDGYDCVQRTGYITVSGAPAAPTADFSGTPRSGTAPLTVRFTDTSTGSPTGWAWFFGDETYGGAWTEQTDAAEWPARLWHSSVALPDGSIVIMGGIGLFGGTGILNDTWLSTDGGATWTQQTEHAEWPAKLGHRSVVMPDGSIVLMGGIDESGIISANDVWMSADAGATWTRQTADAGWPARLFHSSVALPDGNIVLMGGIDIFGSEEMLNDTWLSTDGGASWTRQTEHAAWSARYRHSSVVLPDGSIVLMGGEDDYSGPLNDTWLSTDGGVSWTLQTEHAAWPAKLGQSCVAMPDGSIVLTGGIDESEWIGADDVWRSTDRGRTWTLANANAEWVMKCMHTSVAMPDGSIVLMGGLPFMSLGNDTWRLQPAGSTADNPTHTYTAPGTYSVALQAYNAGGYDSMQKTGYITVWPPSDGGGWDTPTVTPVQTPTTNQANVGGNSAVKKVDVNGTGIGGLIVTGWKQSSPGPGIPPAPGIVYQHFNLVPARFAEITEATITFAVPTAWLEEHGLSAEEIVLYRYNGTAWEALPTTIESITGATVTYTATGPGFSVFAICGIESPGEVVTTPTAAQTTSRAVAEPTAEQTTAAPAGGAAPDLPLPTIAIVAGAVLVLAAGGFLIRRWWRYRQNPALFRDYD